MIEMNTIKKSIIIGSKGYLGRHLSYYLDKNGFKNINFDIQSELVVDQKNFQCLDIRNKNELWKLTPDVDFIFFFAGHTGTVEGFEKYKEFISVNEVGLINLLTWMRETKCKARIIFPSTRLVYKGNAKALKEEDEKQAKTIYAANKIVSEQLLWIYHNAFDLNFTVFRICVPYGNVFDKTFSYGSIGFFLNKAIKGENITLYGDGNIMRTFTHVEDICMLILDAITRNESGNEIYNIAGENLSLLFIVQLIAKKFKVKVDFKEYPEIDWKLESGDTMFDASKLDKLIHYQLKYNFQNWIEKI
jgi:UDP-glucose 4-epimerase